MLEYLMAFFTSTLLCTQSIDRGQIPFCLDFHFYLLKENTGYLRFSGEATKTFNLKHSKVNCLINSNTVFKMS